MTATQLTPDLGVDEPFMTERPEEPHVYAASCDWASRCLGVRKPRFNPRCLVVGSPPFEAKELEEDGWTVLLADLRWPIVGYHLPIYQADAMKLGLAGNSFDALSSTCCLCHVGLGRYGDPVDPDGDAKALREFHRVLKPGAKAAINFGPCIPALHKTVTVGDLHRNYAVPSALDMARVAGFRVLELDLWDSAERRWLTMLEALDQTWTLPGHGKLVTCCYLHMLLEKP